MCSASLGQAVVSVMIAYKLKAVAPKPQFQVWHCRLVAIAWENYTKILFANGAPCHQQVPEHP